MIKNIEEQQEYEMMYDYVMRNSNTILKTKDEIIMYLIEQCYYIDLHNELLTDTIEKMKSILNPYKDIDLSNDLPF